MHTSFSSRASRADRLAVHRVLHNVPTNTGMAFVYSTFRLPSSAAELDCQGRMQIPVSDLHPTGMPAVGRLTGAS